MRDEQAGEIICEFKFTCDKAWDSLQKIEDQSDVRYCGACMKSVFLCHSYEELALHVSRSHCVAIKSRAEHMLMGEVFDFN